MHRFATFFLPIALLILQFNSVFAQEKKKILLKSANELEFNRPVNPDIQILRGNVVFQHEESFMYCDSAYLYINTNAMDAFGNVHVKVSDTTQIYGEKLHYDGNKKTAVMEKDVELIDNNIILRTNKLTYDLDKGVGYYLDGGTIEDPSNTLVSKHGYYYADSKEFFFRHDVVVTGNHFKLTSDSLMYNTITERVNFYGNTHIISDSTHIYCENGWYNTKTDQTLLTNRARMVNGSSVLEGDTLFYDRRLGEGTATMNVVFRDTIESILLRSNSGIFHQTDSSIIATDSAVFITWDATDSLYLHGDTLFSRKDTILGREVKIYHNVRFYRADLQGVCDSLYYSESDSLMKMYLNPCLWSDSTQMSADYIQFLTDKGHIIELLMRKNAFIASHYDADDYQQVKGDLMRGYFDNNELHLMKVLGSAETVYFIEDENGGKTGINKSKSSAIDMHFEEKEVSAIDMKGSPLGTIYPHRELSSEQRKLSGFLWQGLIRPMSPTDVFRNDSTSAGNQNSGQGRGSQPQESNEIPE